jgi:protein SCO1/2
VKPHPILLTICLAGAHLGLAACEGAPAPAARAASDIGGPFRLVDQSGAPVTEAILKGKWTAIFFGYANCPDVCPTTLVALAQAKAALGAKADKLQILFVTVDPARDTPAHLKDYLDNPAFPRGVLGLTGTPEQVAVMAKAYRVYYKKVGEGPGYTMDHTAVVYLMGPDGRFDAPMTFGVPPAQMAEQISKAMDRG